jgi:hypothetical protein
MYFEPVLEELGGIAFRPAVNSDAIWVFRIRRCSALAGLDENKSQFQSVIPAKAGI